MYKFILIICLSFLGFQSSQAQSLIEVDSIYIKEYPLTKNIFKISPFHFADGTFLLSYEHMFNEKQSIMLSAGMHAQQKYFQTEPEFGFQEELQYRFYVSPPKGVGSKGGSFFYFKGIYAGPYATHQYRERTVLSFDWIAQENVNIQENINSVGGGVVLGVQMAFGNVLFLDVYTGGGVRKSWGVVADQSGFGREGITGSGYTGVVPKGGLQIGIGF